ncbi:MAG: sigma-70 family RNA polymerase sigma factor [Verrucomicrobiota bacterium]
MTSPYPPPDEWVDRFGDSLYAFAFQKTADRHSAEEAVQETFLRGMKKLDSFEGRSSLKTWLTGILINVVRENSRLSERLSLIPISNEESPMTLKDLRQLPPDEAIERSEFWEMVDHCLEQLPVKTAGIFWDKEVEGKPTQEIAQEWNTTGNNIWVTLHRARKYMQECMAAAAEWFRGKDPR